MLADAQGWGDLAYSGNETKMREGYIYRYIFSKLTHFSVH